MSGLLIRLAASVVLTTALLFAQASSAQVPSPKEFLGHDVGEDYYLANYSELVRYWTELARVSDRMVLEDIGTTSYGQTHWVAVISSPENLARIDEIRGISHRLALGRDADEAVARELADRGRAVVWVDAGMHATEVVAAQNILELAWQMTSRDDAEVRRILDAVVLLVCPANPDGMELIANAYMATRRVGGIPVLYQRWIGHDNNRDFYAGNQLETRNIQRMHYRRWHPQIVYNHHQSAPRGTIIFTPPFRDPFNYNVDPLVVRGIDLVSSHMNHRFAAERKPGVISRSGARYSAWWNGGLRTTTYFHNMVGILTESFGSPNPSKVEQTLSRRLPYHDHPDPLPSQEWHARQTIEYLQTANFAILDLAARYRNEFAFNAWRMARNSIERGSADHWTPNPQLLALAEAREELQREQRRTGENGDTPTIVPAFEDPDLRDARHYVLSADQPDFAAVTRLVRRLRRAGIEVFRTTEALELPTGGTAPVGSFLIHAAQAFRPHLRDMLEPQWHPDDIGTGGEPVRPYDAAGWTLSMQMNVAVERFFDPVAVAAELVTTVEVPFANGRVTEGAAGWLIDHRDTNHYAVVNRLLAVGAEISWLGSSVDAGDREWPAGSVFVANREGVAARVAEAAREFGVAFHGTARVPAGAGHRLRPTRVGLFDVYGGNMATGWTEWALRGWDFDVESVFGRRVHEGDLKQDYDVLVFHTGLPPATQRGRRDNALRRGRGAVREEDIAKLQEVLPAFEDWSSIGDRRVRLTKDKALPALQEFLADGGSIVALGSQATTLAKHLELPVDEGLWTGEGEERKPLPRSDFYIPGSLVRLDVDVRNPLGYGLTARQAGMFRGSPVFRVTGDGVEVVASYPKDGDVLASGWAIGADHLKGRAAALRAQVATGYVYLLAIDAMYRGQPTGTFKLLFNAIHDAGGSPVTSLDIR